MYKIVARRSVLNYSQSRLAYLSAKADGLMNV